MVFMAKHLIILLFLLPFVLTESTAQENLFNDLLRQEVREYGQARVKIENLDAALINELSLHLSVSSVKGNITEIVLSPLNVEWFLQQSLDYRISVKPDLKSIFGTSAGTKSPGIDSYPGYYQYDSIIKSFVNLYPTLCDPDTIGTSINGKLILAIKISDNADTDEDEPEVFYTSSIHGDELGGFILMLRLADYLLKNYNNESRVKRLVDNLEIWINPLSNPDGAYRNGFTISSPVRFNANGYDLNRNFPDPVTPNTVKQPETIDMVRFLKKRNFVLSANFHAGAEVVNYPWDRWERLHADNSWFYNVSRRYADTVHTYAYAGYLNDLNNGITNGYVWYRINGGRQDYVTGELYGREVTIELDNDFITPVQDLNNLWNYNYRSLLGFLENALFGVHGHVTDSENGNPVPARIYIAGHDKDSSHVYADTISGSFVRFLSPGLWTLRFTSPGYITAYKDVLVEDWKETLLNVEMHRFSGPLDTLATPVPLLYPNPVNDFLRIVMPQHQTGEVNIKIFNSMGRKIMDSDMETFENIPVVINVNHFASGTYIAVITNNVSKIVNKSRFAVLHR